MAKTNMLMREKRRLKVAKKYAARRAELKELIRDPKTGAEERIAAQAELQGQPRDAAAMRQRNRCSDDRTFARRVPQVWIGAHQAARSGQSWGNSRACRRPAGEARTMSMTDPIADLLTRIRNAQSAGKPTVGVGASKLKLAILKVLKDEGYIGAYSVETAGAKSTLSIELKYHDGRPVIDRIERISRPGLRIYRGKDELPKVLGGLGVAVVSTPQGIMSDKQARAAGTGGEVLFVVQ